MRYIVMFLLIVLLQSAALAADYTVRSAVATSKFLRNELPEKNWKISLEAASNEHEAFQLLIRANKPVSKVTVKASDLTSGKSSIKSSNIELRLAHYMHLTKNLGGGYEPGWYPDALLPMPQSFSVNQGDTQMVWVNVYVPQNAKPGTYKGQITLQIDKAQEKINYELIVHNFGISVENHFGSAFAVWGGQCAEHYGISTDSPEYRKMLDRYYWFMVGYRMPPDDLPYPVDSPEAVKYLSDPRVTSYRIPYDPANPDGFKRMTDYLRDNGWLSKGYVYTIDEPAAEDFEKCAQYGRDLHSVVPDAKWLLTAAPHPTMYGAVDIWCPILNAFQPETSLERQALGDHVWWYTCVYPQHPYPTYLINDSAVSPRILSWFQSRYKVEGVLYWALTIWMKYDGSKYIPRDVWNDPLAFPGANGDGYLLYPGKTPTSDPVPTLRLEMIRQGNEDFETLYLLEDRYQKLVQKMQLEGRYDPHSRVVDYSNRLGSSLVSWSDNKMLMEDVRKQMLREIGSLDKGPALVVSASSPEGSVPTGKQVDTTVWAEAGAKVFAKVLSGSKSTPVPVNLSADPDNPRLQSATISFVASTEPETLLVTAQKSGVSKTAKRVFTRPVNRLTKMVNPEILCDWSSQADLDKFNKRDVDMEIINDVDLGKCAKVTFLSNAEFPGMTFSQGSGFQDTDWSNKGYFVISVKNPEDFPISFFLKAFDKKGKKLDGHLVIVAPGESLLDSWKLESISNDVDISDFDHFEFWMNRQGKPVTIYLGKVATTKTMPK